jgi:hypothetical protein
MLVLGGTYLEQLNEIRSITGNVPQKLKKNCYISPENNYYPKIVTSRDVLPSIDSTSPAAEDGISPKPA